MTSWDGITCFCFGPTDEGGDGRYNAIDEFNTEDDDNNDNDDDDIKKEGDDEDNEA